MDCLRIENLGVFIKHRFELRDAACYNNPDVTGTSLENLALSYLGLSINKTHRDEDFSVFPLPIHLQRYAALDSLVSRRLGELLYQKKIENANDIVSPTSLQIQEKVAYMIGQRIAAIRTLDFIGGNRYQRRYGNTTVGSNKVLFKISKVKLPSTKPLIKSSLF